MALYKFRIIIIIIIIKQISWDAPDSTFQNPAGDRFGNYADAVWLHKIRSD